MDITKFKAELLKELHIKHPFTKCPVGTNACTKIVWGEGNPNARLMFIGEAPGRDEDAQGRPFVGRSGQLLTKNLSAAGLKRSDVFITNIVKCRPPENRKPLPAEVTFYKPLLLQEIMIVRPTVICTLGASALEGLIPEPFSITRIRGKILYFDSIKLIPTLHPAYVLRNNSSEGDFLADIIKAYQHSIS